jgi:hypothetical protein
MLIAASKSKRPVDAPSQGKPFQDVESAAGAVAFHDMGMIERSALEGNQTCSFSVSQNSESCDRDRGNNVSRDSVDHAPCARAFSLWTGSSRMIQAEHLLVGRSTKYYGIPITTKPRFKTCHIVPIRLRRPLITWDTVLCLPSSLRDYLPSLRQNICHGEV